MGNNDWTEAGSGNSKTWDKEKNNVIQGLYKSKKSNVGPNQSNVYNIQVNGEDEVTGVWGSTVLDGRFEEIPEGSEVRIEYLGTAQGKRGQYADYKVLYKAAPEFDAPKQADLPTTVE